MGKRSKSTPTIVINAPPNARRRKGGRQAASVSVETKPIVHNFAELSSNPGPVLAMADALTEAIQSVGASVSPETIKRRQRYSREYARAKQTATRRYGAARVVARRGQEPVPRKRGEPGDMPPRQGATEWFNDSGRMAEGLAVTSIPGASEFRINFPSNRFDITTFGSIAQMDLMRARFDQLVKPARAVRSKSVGKAIEASLRDAIKPGQLKARERRELRDELKNLAPSSFGLLRALL